MTIYEDHRCEYPYPPAGWLPFWEHELGNGDMFGLYWPVGKEDDEPLVVEMWHDSWEMSPQYSSLAAFLAASNALDHATDRPDPTNPLDENSPVVMLDQVRRMISNSKIEDAIETLRRCLQVLPEYTAAKQLLVRQYQRNRNVSSAVQICLDVLRSPLHFGRLNEQLSLWFSRQTCATEQVASDPLWVRRSEITWKFGSTKENDNYAVLKDVIAEYAARGEWTNWYNMSQVYGELMYSETNPFQERYGFDPRKWQSDLIDTYREKTGIDRNALRCYQGS